MICICCKKESYNKKDFYIMHGVHRSEGEELCRECAKIIGVKNAFSACMYTKDQIFKKYSKANPEYQYNYTPIYSKEDLVSDIKDIKQGIQKIKKKYNEKKYLASLKEKTEEKYTCSNCGEVWFQNRTDTLVDLANIMHLNIYTSNQLNKTDRCPKCRSSAFTHHTVRYWIDKQGNCVKIEE